MTDLAPVADEVTPEQHKRLRWALVLISLAQLMVVLDVDRVLELSPDLMAA